VGAIIRFVINTLSSYVCKGSCQCLMSLTVLLVYSYCLWSV